MRPEFQKISDRLGLSNLHGTKLTEKETHELSQQCIGAAEGTRRQHHQLYGVPVSLHDYLLGLKPDHGLDFPFLDALIAKADAVLADDPAAGYISNGTRCSLAAAAEELRGALEGAAAFRSVPRP